MNSPAGRWRLRIEVDEAESKVVAAVDEDGTVLGLAAAGATRDDDAPTDWELYSVNVLADARGSGVADELIDSVIAQRPATLWVVRDNARAQAFYRRRGFRVQGAAKVSEDTGAPEIRMVRESAVTER